MYIYTGTKMSQLKLIEKTLELETYYISITLYTEYILV